MAEVAVSVALSLIEKVIGFLSHEFENTFGNVDEIKTSLKTMQALLRDAEGAEGGEVIKDLIMRTRNVSHEIEDVLDEFMLHAPRHFSSHPFLQKTYMVCHDTKHWIQLHAIKSKMLDIIRRIQGIESSQVYAELLKRQSFRSEDSDSRWSSQHHMSSPEILEDDDLLGVDEMKDRLIGQLIYSHQKRRRIIAVVGPAGSGKTVLVNNVFRNRKVQGQFEFCAWVSASLSSSSSAVNGQNMLAKVQMGRDEQEISLKELRKRLSGKRYIVVVDNIQSVQKWRCIECELPNEPNDSRIVVTTINSQVAAACAGFTDHIHQIDGLAGNESWNLFCRKAFKVDYGKCPPELVDLAQKIVKRCEGIPIAIAAVGSLLSTKVLLPAVWEKIHNNLGPEIESSSNETISNMLLQSFKDLPSNLKSCFLYFSIFPEDGSVRRGRLIRLWVAEGFVKKTGRKPLEETAEDYLNELIERNLVLATSRDLDGRVRSCRVLNLVREFAIMKSEEENFAAVLMDSDGTNSWEKPRRLSVHNFNLEKIRGKANLNHVRTLSAFGSCKDVFSNIRVKNGEFKNLKVLDLQNASIEKFPESIAEMALLMYLSLRGTNVRNVPNSIEELRYLEYLDLKHTHVSVLPKEVCKLHRLRHLLVSSNNTGNSNTFNNILGADVLGPIGALLSLQKLSLIKAKDKKFFQELGNLEQLQKLGLIELMEEDGKHLWESIKKMQNLSVLYLRSASVEEYLDLDHKAEFCSNLQRLYLNGRLLKLPRWVNESLSSVVRIQLKGSKLTESPTHVLQVLPNLMELQMVDAFIGEVLIFKVGSFQKLKMLHIEQFCYLDTMFVDEGAMPKLQKLTIVKCINLRVLPYGIVGLTSLEELLVHDMPPEFTNRLEKDTQDREMINHIPVIRSFTTGANGSSERSKSYY